MTALQYCTVTATFDDQAGGVSTPLQGQVTFTCDARDPSGRYAPRLQLISETPPRTITLDPVPVALNGSGALSVSLVGSGQTGVTAPDTFTWTAKFDLKTAAGVPVPVAPFSFTPTAGATVDLTLVAPAVTNNGIGYITGPPGPPGPPGGAPLDSPAFTGTPTAPTQAAGNNSTEIGTTAYTDRAVATQAAADSGTYVPARQGRAAPRSFQAALGGVTPTAWDAFQRSDRELLLDYAPSGQQYRVTGSQTAAIQGGALVTVPPTGQSDINLIDLPTPPTAGAIQWVFTPGSSAEQNVVIGICSNGFGSNSVQIATDPTQWYLFAPPEGNLGPYPFLGQHSFASDLLIDGKTVYQLSWHYDEATGSVTIIGPDGVSVTVNDPFIAAFWGNTVGVQVRRPATGGTDGSATILGWAVGGSVPSATPSASPAPGLVPYFPGDNAGYMRTSYHGTRVAWTRDDLSCVACVAPKQWNSGSEQSIVSEFASSMRCFDFRVASNGKIRLEVTTDGSTVLNAISDTAVPAVDARPAWIRADRTAASGVCTFYYSLDPVTTPEASVNWTQLGATQSTTAGDVFTSEAPFLVGASATSGSEVSNGFTGIIYTAQVFGHVGSSTKLVAGVDFRGVWTGFGLAGTWWWFVGSTITWQVALALLSSPPTHHVQVFTSAGTWVNPGVTTAALTAVGGGGSGAGAGAGHATAQSGAGGGAAGNATQQLVTLTPGTNLAVSPGAGGAAASGGSASGTIGNDGGATTITGTGISLTAPGGSGGVASGSASSATTAGGNCFGLARVAGQYLPGSGGTGGQPQNQGANGSMLAPGGGSGGASATATLGGSGGNAGTASTGGAAKTSNTATVNGGDGASAAANSGAGGGGGGGGAPGGTGGSGGAGASGFAVIEWWQ